MQKRRPVPKKWIRDDSDRKAIEEGCYFDFTAARRPCDFIEEFCRQYKGEWNGQTIKLIPWERDFLHRLYGWKRPNGRRRYKSGYVEIPKKNGKSTLESGQGLYHLVADHEPGAEVYINAFDRDQAGIIYKGCAHMVRSSPELRRIIKAVDSQKTLYHKASESFLRANSRETASKDGVSASFVIFDELHRQATDEMYSIFRYAGTSRRQPLQVDITTAGTDQQSICYRRHTYSEGVNDGSVDDTSHLGIIYGATEADDLESPAVWKRVNPSWGKTFSAEEFERDYKKAKMSAAEWLDFIRYRLNVWTAKSTRLISPKQWRDCKGDMPSDEELSHLPCYGGVDLASITDLTALARVWPLSDGRIAVKVDYWVPEDQIEVRERRDRVKYRAWALEGHIKTTPGPATDYDHVRADVLERNDESPFKSLLCDPWSAQQLATQWRSSDGLPVEFIRQGFYSLAGPTKEFERLVVTKKIVHAGDPVTAWCVTNAVAEMDAAGNIKLSKKLSRERIDGAAAIINAIAGYIGAPLEAEAGVYLL
jgi:phage terminase large subunit-like protein